MRVGFVGTGAIGSPMARRLIPAHDVIVFDPDAERVGALVRDGAAAAATAAEAVRGADAAVIMVATPAQLEIALFGEDGVTEGAAAGAAVIIMSSVGREAVVGAAGRLEALGLRVLDAPVTGGVARATTGELTLLLGGDEEVITALEPVLGLLGTKLARCGPRIGDGQSVKLVNQLLCAVHLVAAAEALSLAGSLGLDPAAVLAIVESGAAGSFMLSDRGPRMLASDPPVLSAVDIFAKDSQLVAEAADAAGLGIPLLEAARAKFAAAQRAGLHRADDSTVIRTYAAAGTPEAFAARPSAGT